MALKQTLKFGQAVAEPELEVIDLDDLPEVDGDPEDFEPVRVVNQKPKKPATKKARTHASHAPALLIAALFGLALTSGAWLFGAVTTVQFLSFIGLSWPVRVWQISVNLNWLIPLGVTAFEVSYRPPLTLKELILHVRTDPTMTGLWLLVTGVAVITTFGGLLTWLFSLQLIFNDLDIYAAWILLSFAAIAIEYLPEPLAIRFVSEFSVALKAILR